MRKSSDIVLDKCVKLLSSGKKVNQFPAEIKSQVERWQYAYDTLMKHQGKSYKFIIELLKLRYPNLSDMTFYQDIANAKALFARLTRPNLDFERIVAIERLKRNIERATLNEDFRAVASLENVLSSYIQSELDKPEEINYEDLEVNISVTFDPELLGIKPIPDKLIQATIRDAHKHKKDKDMSRFAEDVEFEDAE